MLFRTKTYMDIAQDTKQAQYLNQQEKNTDFLTFNSILDSLCIHNILNTIKN